MRDQGRLDAAEQYTKATRLLAAAMTGFNDAHVPLEPRTNGEPPTWTAEHREAVWATAWAWTLLATARRSWDEADGSMT
jgi:hypothetical protein